MDQSVTTPTQAQRSMNIAAAKYEKANRLFQKSVSESQVSIFGGAVSEESLFKRDIREEFKIVQRLKTEADRAKMDYDEAIISGNTGTQQNQINLF